MDTTLTTGTDEAAVESIVALAGLIRKARNIGGWYEADVISTDHIESDLVAKALLQAARADPAAARAVRDAIDPDGLRAALRRDIEAMGWYADYVAPFGEVGGPSLHVEIANSRRALEGTPDAD